MDETEPRTPVDLSPEDIHINQLALDYQKLSAARLSTLFTTAESRSWLQQFLTSKLALDKRRRPYHDQVVSLSRRLQDPRKISARTVAHLLTEARLRWEEQNEIIEVAAAFAEEQYDEIQVLQSQMERIAAEVIHGCLRLIQAISKYYSNRHREAPDFYMGTATIGLMKGILRWDPKLQTFTKYIFTWMLNEISEAYSHRGIVTPPGRMTIEFAKMEQKSHELHSKLERPPTNEELAEALTQPLAYVERLKREHLSIVYLDAPLESENEETDANLHNSMAMSYQDDRGGAIHRVDTNRVLERIRAGVAINLARGDGIIGLRLKAEAFVPVEGRYRIMDDAMLRLRGIGMNGLKLELRDDLKRGSSAS